MTYKVILESLIIILFPLLVYFLFLSLEDYNKYKKELLLKITIFTEIYLLFIFEGNTISYYPITLLSLPMLISLYKKFTSFYMISLLSMVVYCIFNGMPLYFVLPDILFSILIYNFTPKKDVNKSVNIFILYRTILALVYMFIYPVGIFIYLIRLLIYVIISKFVILVIKYADNVINYKKTIENLEKEKEIQKSLFQITHEIKNPIAVCKGYMEMLNEKTPLKKYQQYIPIIKEEINRTLLIIDDFSSLSKVTINKEVLDINVLIDDVVNSIDILLKENNIVLNYKASEDEIYIMGDYNRLKQVLVNIIKNSKESLDERSDGVISIKTSKNKSSIKIEINDNGIGMDEETLSKVKDAFFTTKKNGTGLGLYLSNDIITKHNGVIEYDSKKDKYTKCTIKLPLYKGCD